MRRGEGKVPRKESKERGGKRRENRSRDVYCHTLLIGLAYRLYTVSRARSEATTIALLLFPALSLVRQYKMGMERSDKATKSAGEEREFGRERAGLIRQGNQRKEVRDKQREKKHGRRTGKVRKEEHSTKGKEKETYPVLSSTAPCKVVGLDRFHRIGHHRCTEPTIYDMKHKYPIM